MIQSLKSKIAYGDFQTPLELAERVCDKLIELGVEPGLVVEPTCGTGSFIKASAHAFETAKRIVGLEINPDYIAEIQSQCWVRGNNKIQLVQQDFFDFDWRSLENQVEEKILAIGNLPWVTNSQQGTINGKNLPQKQNFQQFRGLDALTGRSNFDISEWMLIQLVEWLHKYPSYLAILCKTSVSRKLLNHIHAKKLNLEYCAVYKIDAKKYFEATVDACLLFCEFRLNSCNYFCDVFDEFNQSHPQRIGYQKNVLVQNLTVFNQLKELYNSYNSRSCIEKWRSGVKHDCASVMEFRKSGDILINGLGEVVDIEDTCLLPLLKGADVAQNRIESTERYVLTTQKFVGEQTDYIKTLAPKTWHYLEAHSSYLDNRKSRIYQNNPRFSIFGVGSYTFLPWKIAICSLYKKLEFRLIGTIDDKPVVFDDTVYFLGFDNQETAHRAFLLLTSSLAKDFYSSLIFWDEKRPIKTSILNSLNLVALADRLSVVV